MEKQPPSIANFIEPGPESVKLRDAKVLVELTVGTSQRHSFYKGFTDEMSATGVFVGTHIVKPLGERMDFSIRLPDSDEPIAGTCEVSWLREYKENSDAGPGLGLRFLDLDAAAEARIAAFLEQEQALFYDDE